MIYVGVVAGLLGIPWEAVEHGVRRQFLTKPKAVPVNLDAIKVGYDYWQDNFSKQDPYRLEPMQGVVEGKVLVEGNQAAALGALMGGVTVVAWYPITPSSSLCEYLVAYADRFRVDTATGEKLISVVQAEDELAAVGMAIGAGWAGARAMTSTSGPGISLMAEFSGLAYYAEVPVVIFDIQRIGPSTGLPTRTSQADLGFVYTLSHGDTKHMVLLPGTVEECYEFARDAFDYADRFQTPVFVLSDLDLGSSTRTSPSTAARFSPKTTSSAWPASGRATATWTATVSRIARCRGPTIRRPATLPVALATMRWPATQKAPMRTLGTWTGSRASWKPPGMSCPPRWRTKLARRLH